MMCHILVFLEVMSVMKNNATSITLGKYALVHFVNQDVFSKCPNQTLYGHTYNDLMATAGWLQDGQRKQAEYHVLKI